MTQAQITNSSISKGLKNVVINSTKSSIESLGNSIDNYIKMENLYLQDGKINSTATNFDISNTNNLNSNNNINLKNSKNSYNKLNEMRKEKYQKKLNDNIKEENNNNININIDNINNNEEENEIEEKEEKDLSKNYNFIENSKDSFSMFTCTKGAFNANNIKNNPGFYTVTTCLVAQSIFFITLICKQTITSFAKLLILANPPK